ncbi:hypothetical protein N2152v2_007167 [Parachlorella kessleri]
MSHQVTLLATFPAVAEASIVADAAPGVPKKWIVLVETMLPDNGNPCGTFFQASEPSQSKAPATAYRYALKTLFNKAALDTLGNGDVVERLAIQCSNPKQGTVATNRRIRLKVTTAALTEDDVVSVVRQFFWSSYEPTRVFADAVVALGGGGEFEPTPFLYKLPNNPGAGSGTFAVCIEAAQRFACPDEAHRSWNPDNAILAYT